MDSDVFTIEKSKTGKRAIRISLCEHKGRRLIMISHMWKKKGVEEWQRSTMNVTMNIDEYEEVRKILNGERKNIRKFFSK